MEIHLSNREIAAAYRAKILREAENQTNTDGWFVFMDVMRVVLDTYWVPQYDYSKWSRDLQDRGLITHTTVPNRNYGHFVLTDSGHALLTLSK